MPDPTSAPMQPQDAFQELAAVTLADHSMDTVMTKVAGLVKHTVPRAAEVSVTMMERGRATTIAATGRLAAELDERQYEVGYGPCLSSVEGGEPVAINDMTADRRFGEWTKAAAAAGACSSLSIPVPLQREVTAALNIYSAEQNAFDEKGVELATAFAAYAGVALANMHLYEAQGEVAQQLQAAMRSRAVIEQAKGILMGQHRCSAEDAFDMLVALSQDANRKLRDVAQALIEQRLRGSSG